jgi:hypothetical protein
MDETIIDKWRQGISLDDAVWNFASRRMQAAHRTARRKPAHSRAESQRTPNTMSAPESIQNISGQALQVLEHIRSQVEVRDEMRRQLLDKLADGKLVAYGFPVNNETASDQADEIPPFLFELKFVNWFNSSLKGLGREYVSVRVIRVGRAQLKSSQSQRQPLPIIPPRRAVGRPPSKREAILEEIGSLYKEGINLGSCSSKQVGALVRNRMAERYGRPPNDVKGLSDETIRRAHAAYKAQKG